MNYRVIHFFLFVGILFTSALAHAQANIAVVDVARLLAESKAGQDIQNQVQKHREEFLATLGEQEDKLREQERTLNEKSATVSQEELEKLRQDFEKKFLEARNKAQQRKAVLDKAVAEAMTDLREKMFESIRAVAEEKAYDVVITSQSTVVVNDAIDISDESLEHLDSKVQSIAVKVDDE